MILIADSGSTKTEWVLIDKTGPLSNITTIGLNPFHNSDQQILHELEKVKISFINSLEIKYVYFYGSGCNVQQESRMQILIKSKFESAEVYVYSDILGAARALFGNMSGVIGILGTGSNAVAYNFGKIEAGIISMGYQLGDEGSGAVLGRELLKLWLRNELGIELGRKFQNQYNLTYEIILDNIYSKPFPNRYMASFVPFLSENINDELVINLLKTNFNYYFKYQLLNISKSVNYEIGIIGSVGYNFSEIIQDIAKNYGLRISKFIKNPINNLVNYHINELR